MATTGAIGLRVNASTPAFVSAGVMFRSHARVLAWEFIDEEPRNRRPADARPAPWGTSVGGAGGGRPLASGDAGPGIPRCQVVGGAAHSRGDQRRHGPRVRRWNHP